MQQSGLLLSTILTVYTFQQFRFIVLSKYILTEKYQGSGLLITKIWIVEEMPTVGFDANNNMDFLILLHNTNNRKKHQKKFFLSFTKNVILDGGFESVFYTHFS